jgi:RNA polymerase sigma factor (TIGR02999 family)
MRTGCPPAIAPKFGETAGNARIPSPMAEVCRSGNPDMEGAIRSLVDHARSRLAAKRGAGAARLTLNPELAPAQKQEIDLIALDDALGKLNALDAQQGRLIELRFFGELSIEETALVMGISPATVKREWATARAWLQRELKRDART